MRAHNQAAFHEPAEGGYELRMLLRALEVDRQRRARGFSSAAAACSAQGQASKQEKFDRRKGLKKRIGGRAMAVSNASRGSL
jgi:hypothetical protein